MIHRIKIKQKTKTCVPLIPSPHDTLSPATGVSQKLTIKAVINFLRYVFRWNVNCFYYFHVIIQKSYVSVCLSERYRIQSDSFEDMWLVVKELVQRFDQHFAKLGVKDFKKSFSGPLPLQEYFLSVDHHFQVHIHLHTNIIDCIPETNID